MYSFPKYIAFLPYIYDTWIVLEFNKKILDKEKGIKCRLYLSEAKLNLFDFICGKRLKQWFNYEKYSSSQFYISISITAIESAIDSSTKWLSLILLKRTSQMMYYGCSDWFKEGIYYLLVLYS